MKIFLMQSRVFFKTQSDLNIQCGNEYDVQWGRSEVVDRAVVLHAGCEQDMRAKLREMEDTECLPASPSSSTFLPPSNTPHRNAKNQINVYLSELNYNK